MLGSKGDLLSISWIYFYLPVPALKVKGRKPLCITQQVQQIINAGKWVVILLNGGIQFPVIYTKAQTSISFPNQYNWRGY